MDASHITRYEPYLGSVIFLFSNHSKLSRYLTDEYINVHEGFIEQSKLIQVSKPWSRSEKFMLKLALHLYSGQVKIDLNDIDFLDNDNKQIDMEALKIRFKGM